MAIKVKNYREALRVATDAGKDAANKRMRRAGRTAWSADDYAFACEMTDGTLIALGYDMQTAWEKSNPL